ncbi:hypothetical protein, partial [Escherichia coli]
QMLYWLGIGAIVTIVAACLAMMLNSYSNNRSYLEQVGDKATKLGQEAKKYTEAPDLLKAVTFAEHVKDTTSSREIPDLSSP